ncbi:endolytic transglycosylase MltG [uncultured Cohaesibacter sp.]|uniref:endolytic transglycosylase MltG n=1 Tax=uncultured Cohaesibacter sp. TaxID=1002546 RepID=UPI0029C6A066|nr:endolytic transglycosylase MltG [uncultured Cohaesibacter sp.]
MVDGKDDKDTLQEEQKGEPEVSKDTEKAAEKSSETEPSDQVAKKPEASSDKDEADGADADASGLSGAEPAAEQQETDAQAQAIDDAKEGTSAQREADIISSMTSDTGEVKTPKSARQAIEPETPPPPPPRSKAVRHPIVVFMNFIITVVLLAVLAIGGALYYGKQTFIEAGPLKQEKTILVSGGTGLTTIADILERQNVISDQTIFNYGVQIYRQDTKLKAGEYLFRPGVSMMQVMQILTSGKSILHSVTIPEGYTSYQIYQVLMDDDVLVGDLSDVPAEGSLLPETYKFSRGTTRQEMVKRMADAHERAVTEIWGRRATDLPLKTPEELVTLASIVEKETGKASERTRVAGVFINRLNQGIRLQSDPTVIYGIFGGEGKPKDRPIFRSDLDKKTDYNTYQIPGLTPGPIANPGLASLEAVANPSRTKELYFVADGTGGHVFSETLKEHNENVRRWREIEKQRIEDAKQQGTDAAGSAEGAEEKPAQ